ncbi:hypothetical protein [Wolbachia endosymbiont of Atemnus politus]|uniref:hypothetical protein n=1 Tax=Wolbachia endosymbiont of Atemnus politus TaxID=2682840 RepID=UPI0034E28FE3
MFVHAGAAVFPSNSIIEELITHYNRLGYKKFFSFRNQTFHPFGLRVYSSYFSNPSYREMTCMSCEDSNCLKFSFSVDDGIYNDNKILVCNLQDSVEFKLKCEGENVRYEEGKVSFATKQVVKIYSMLLLNIFRSFAKN